MKNNVSISFKGGQAFYVVSVESDGMFQAHLLRYTGTPSHVPPSELYLKKQGPHWTNNETEQEFLDELGMAIEQQAKSPAYEFRYR